jgi:hypothetical protein
MAINITWCKFLAISQLAQPLQRLDELLSIFKKANKVCICSYHGPTLTSKKANEQWVQIEQVFFSFYHNTCNYVLHHKIPTPW